MGSYESEDKGGIRTLGGLCSFLEIHCLNLEVKCHVGYWRATLKEIGGGESFTWDSGSGIKSAILGVVNKYDNRKA